MARPLIHTCKSDRNCFCTKLQKKNKKKIKNVVLFLLVTCCFSRLHSLTSVLLQRNTLHFSERFIKCCLDDFFIEYMELYGLWARLSHQHRIHPQSLSLQKIAEQLGPRSRSLGKMCGRFHLSALIVIVQGHWFCHHYLPTRTLYSSAKLEIQRMFIMFQILEHNEHTNASYTTETKTKLESHFSDTHLRTSLHLRLCKILYIVKHFDLHVCMKGDIKIKFIVAVVFVVISL